MTKKEIRQVEHEHMAERPKSFLYRGRALVCTHCTKRFRQRHNGTLMLLDTGETK